MYVIMARCFPVSWVSILVSPGVYSPQDIQVFTILLLCCLSIGPFCFIMFFYHILLQNCFVSFASDCSCAFPTDLVVEFSFVILENPILFELLFLIRYLLRLPSSASIFGFISSHCIFILICCFFFDVFLFHGVLVDFSFFCTFSSFRSFFTPFTSPIFHPDRLIPPKFLLPFYLFV